MLKTGETKKRMALGQGLDALIPLDQPVGRKTDQDIIHVPIESLAPNPDQPRRTFSDASLRELSDSIREMGVIQPLIARSISVGYEIVAGERRWRAAQLAGFSTIPIIVKSLSDSESLEIALIENIQREDLNALDTAEAYDLLIKKFSYTHEVLAKRIGKDRSSITNHLRLLKLPDPIKMDLRAEKLSVGHAKTLLSVEHLPLQLSLSRQVVRRELSVRDLERIVQNYKNKQNKGESKPAIKDPDIERLEKNLSTHLSTRVALKRKQDKSGKIEIFFHSQEELDRLIDVLGYSEDLS
jgi:ParB family transcriptional regulator, chromosome partitioning protein